jgi:hypothetical protein
LAILSISFGVKSGPVVLQQLAHCKQSIRLEHLIMRFLNNIIEVFWVVFSSGYPEIFCGLSVLKEPEFYRTLHS